MSNSLELLTCYILICLEHLLAGFIVNLFLYLIDLPPYHRKGFMDIFQLSQIGGETGDQYIWKLSKTRTLLYYFIYNVHWSTFSFVTTDLCSSIV